MIIGVDAPRQTFGIRNALMLMGTVVLSAVLRLFVDEWWIVSLALLVVGELLALWALRVAVGRTSRDSHCS